MKRIAWFSAFAFCIALIVAGWPLRGPQPAFGACGSTIALTGAGCGAPGGGGLGLQTSVTAMWEFETTSWTDSSGNGNTLTPSVSPPTLVAGVVGNAANFVLASSQKLSIASNSGISVGGGTYSIQCWVKALVTTGAWCAKDDGGFANREWAFFDAFSGGHFYAFAFFQSNGTEIDIISSVAVDTTAFHQLVATWDGTTVRFYVDAGTPATATPSASVSSTSQVFIGDGGNGEGFATAAVDQVVIAKNRVWTGANVTTLFNGGSGLSWAAMQ